MLQKDLVMLLIEARLLGPQLWGAWIIPQLSERKALVLHWSPMDPDSNPAYAAFWVAGSG